MADVELTVVVPEANVASFQEAFLRANPKTDSELSDKAWVEQEIEYWLRRRHKRGKLLLAADATVIEDPFE